jgi:amino acid transporter
MSGGERHGMSHHPAPHRNRVALWESALGILGGPLAWFAQLCISYALFSTPCFPDAQRIARLADPAGIFAAGLVVYLLCLGIALAGASVSLRVYRRTRGEAGGASDALLDAGRGRTRFLALWGVLLGAGFAVAIIVTAIAMLEVPACA